MNPEMYRLSVQELLKGFSDGTLTCEAYAQRVIKRARDLSAFNYFVSMDTERLLEGARQADARYADKTNRALEGIPVALKDNIDVEGEVTGAGTPALSGLRSTRTAEVVRRLLAAGAIHAGRTNMHELAYGTSTTNAYTGDSHNFHNFDFTCGGSSGGSAGAVAADIVPVALGTDTGGSVRIPASYCGVYGLRPTIGRWPCDYGLKATHSRDSVGPLVRSPGDLALLNTVVTGEDPPAYLSPADIRIGVPRSHFWENLHPEVQEYSEMVLATLTRKGFVVIDEGTIPDLADVCQKYFLPSINKELIPCFREYLQEQGHKVTLEEIGEKIASPDVKAGFASSLRDPPSQDVLTAAEEAKSKLIRDFGRYFQEHRVDCILMPASKIPPSTLEAFKADTSGELMVVVENHDCANVCNNPSLVVPGGFSRCSGAPFGMQIEGLPGTDGRLIAISGAIHKALAV